jgi:hypothetical protein
VIAAIDGTPLTLTSGGLRRYTEELTSALRQNFPDDEFHLVSDQLQHVSGLDRRWWTIGVQRAMRGLNCDVFHGTDFAVPYLPLRPSVLTLLDLSPWLDPRWHHAASRVRRRTPYLIKLGIATMILTITEAIRGSAIEYFNISPSRIVSVHWRLPAISNLSTCRPPRRLTSCTSARSSRGKTCPPLLEPGSTSGQSSCGLGDRRQATSRRAIAGLPAGLARFGRSRR